jgi:hypothetical protein
MYVHTQISLKQMRRTFHYKLGDESRRHLREGEGEREGGVSATPNLAAKMEI